MYREAWPNWSSVPTLHKGHMFEEFQKLFQWDSQCDGLMKTTFFNVCGRRLREMLRTARDNAFKKAEKEDGVGSTNIGTYNPPWINQDLWLSLLTHWNKPEWKNISAVNSSNSEKRTGGSHTTGSCGFLKSRQRLEQILGRPAKMWETFIYNHVKKGTNPFELDASGNPLQPDFVNDKSRLFAEKLKRLFGEKFGSDENEYPSFDQEIWEECTGGKKKGNYYGSGSSTDPCYVLTGTPSSKSSCSSYATQQPQVQELTLTVEEMREKHEVYQRDLDEMKLREERQKKELEDMRAKNEELHAKNEAEKMEMKKTIDLLMKYLPKTPPPS